MATMELGKLRSLASCADPRDQQRTTDTTRLAA